MVKRYVSVEARLIHGLSVELRFEFSRKGMGLRLDTLRDIMTSCSEKIQEIDTLLRHPLVRGEKDPRTFLPDVTKKLSIYNVTLRLKRQARAACILADAAHQGPAANDHEQAVISGVEEKLSVLVEAFPVMSLLDKFKKCSF